jgi:hypothetical protein
MLDETDFREILANEFGEAGYPALAKAIRDGADQPSIFACLTAMAEVQKRAIEIVRSDLFEGLSIQ